MKWKVVLAAGAALAATLALTTQADAARPAGAARANLAGPGQIQHVLLISIDGMHALDFYNCSRGVAGVNDGKPYCPNLAALGTTGINYVSAVSSKPSDSFPGLTALITGGTPKTTGIYYDVAFDRSLDGPQVTTGSGLAPSHCAPYGTPTGTTTDNTNGIDIDDSKLNGGAPGAGLADGGVASIDLRRLERDPKYGCAVVFPWNFIRTNTIFGVVHAAGGYTAWIDKRPSYAFVNGPGAYPNRVDDLFLPEVASNVVPLPGIKTATGISCDPVRDTTQMSGWTSSFANVQCYDALRVNGLLNEISGKTHDGQPAKTPAVFGMNFQSVYYGESLVEPGFPKGGYLNAAGAPGAELLNEIEFVDASIGQIVGHLRGAGIFNNTLLIVTAKHGGSPIDPTLYVADGDNTPATLLSDDIPYSESPLNPTGVGATEDDVSVIWLNKGVNVDSAVKVLEENAAAIGLGQIYYGPTLALNYGVPGWDAGDDPRTPDIIVTPNIGVTYSGSASMIADHGGFAHDDTNVMLLVENPSFTPQTVQAGVTTTQVAPTIVKALGLDPSQLDAVRAEGTESLPEVFGQLSGSPQ